MKFLFSTIFLLILGSLQFVHAAKLDYSSLPVGDEARVDIDFLHPTQFRVGDAEVEEKQLDFMKMGPKKLKAYLKSHPCPVVIGPGGVPYVTDEQHRANAGFDAEKTHRAVRALRENGQPTMYMKVVANYSHMTQEEFEKAMIENHYCFLNDLGKERSFKDLPRHVYQMKNDPYRSVAGFVERKAYQMTDVYFAQFKVADWLRDRLKMNDSKVTRELKKHRKAFLKKASELLQSPEAKAEPWYLAPDSASESECEKSYRSLKK